MLKYGHQYSSKTHLRTRQLAFLILVGLLSLQVYVIYDLGEPYPAVWAPGFPGGRATTTYIRPAVTFRFADGTDRTVSQAQLLSSFPDSHHGALMAFFVPLDHDGPPADRLLHRVLPGFVRGRFNRKSRMPQIWEWFVDRSERLFGRRDLLSVRVDWRIHSNQSHDVVGNDGVFEVSQLNAQ